MVVGKFIQIDPSSGMPVYRQVMNQIKQAIASGVLKMDDQLPTIRDLAKEIQINPNTIAKAYNELEHEGAIYKKQGMGSFVAKPEGKKTGTKERNNSAFKAATRFWVEVWPLNLTTKESLKCLEGAAQKLNRKFDWKKEK